MTAFVRRQHTRETHHSISSHEKNHPGGLYIRMEYSLGLVDLELGILKWTLELIRNERKKERQISIDRQDLLIDKLCLIDAYILCLCEPRSDMIGLHFNTV
jgi:hypothetical protein